MPLYEYQCKKCGKQFEKVVSISEAGKKQICPYCGGKNTEKMLSVFSAKSSSSAGVSGGGFT
jgi:putative FmdB family regulatory protein